MSEIEEDPEAAEFARWLFAQSCDFVAGASSEKQLPPPLGPEVAFVGRSNVGKSSLVNALTGRTTLAKVSRTPGRTQQINFFDLGRRLVLVDLPGYGYAKAAKTRIDAWTELTRRYLHGRKDLERVLVLIDARHGLKPSDREVMQALDEAARPYQVVLTKADLVKGAEREALLQQVEAQASRFRAAHPRVIQTSSAKDMGIAELRQELAALASRDAAH